MPQLLIDITGSGSGPLTAAGSWEWSWELDRAGPISFPISAADPQARHLDTDRQVVASVLRDGSPRLDVGAGIVEELGDEVQRRGAARRQVGGSDLLIELATRTVGNLSLSDGAGGPMAAGSVLGAIMAHAPAGWTITGTPSGGVYLPFAGETVLAALGKVCEQTGDHFRLAGPTLRQVAWQPTTTAPVASGVRAVQDGDPGALRNNPRVCLIRRLKRVTDATGQYSRIYAYGAGNASARVTLSGGTWTPPAGYTLDLVNNCLIHDATDAARRKDHYQAFKDIGTSGSTAADAVSAANALRQAAYEQLRRHLLPQRSYELEVTKLDLPVLPGQTIRVVYQEWTGSTKTLDIDEDLWVLAVKQRIDKNGRTRTVSLTVAATDRWPMSDTELHVAALGQAASMERHTQPAVTATSVTDGNMAKLNAIQSFSAKQTFAAGADGGLTTTTDVRADNLYIPRRRDITNLIMLDNQDELAALTSRPGRTATITPAPSSGTLASVFVDNTDNIAYNAGTSPYPIVIEIDCSTNPITPRNSQSYRLALTFRSTFTGTDPGPTSYTLEAWNSTTSAYVVVGSGALTPVDLMVLLPTWTSPSTNINKLRLTLSGTNPIPTGTTMRIQRLILYHRTAPWDPWHLHILGGSVWGNVAVGAGAPETPTSVLQVVGPIATAYALKTAAYTLTATDSIIAADASAAPFTLTLPTAVGCTGRQYTAKRLNAGANAVTLACTGAQTIDGAATYALTAQWQVARLMSDGANWLIM